MGRNRSKGSSGNSKPETTLSRPRLSSDQLHHLRDALEKRALRTVSEERGEVLPPWRRIPKASISPKLRNAEVKPRRRDRRTTSPHPEPANNPASEGPVRPRAAAFEYWDFPGEAAVREPPPVSVSDTDRSHFRALLEAGTDGPSVGGDDLFVYLGLDFGTSSTKTIVRLPFEAGEPTIAIPAPASCRSGEDPYLWQTVLWLRAGGTFCPWPEPGATALHSLKQGLIQGRSDTAIFDGKLAASVSRAQAGVAYLAFVIRHAKGWLAHNRPDLFRGREPIWLVNLGMPTASYDDRQLVRPYRRVGAAALLLSKIDAQVTVEATCMSLNHPDVIRAGASEEADEALAVTVLPEAAAEMTGFAKSTRRAPGLYLLADVGAMTLDACMFRLTSNGTSGDLYEFMAAQVRPLGVDSYHWFLTEGKTESGFVGQCDRMLREIVWHTRKRRCPEAETWIRGNDVPVFLAGGGAANRLHQNVVESLGPWLRQHVGNQGVRVLELPVPGTIELPELLNDFGRMAVAWGLSYPPTEIGRIRPMRDIEDAPPPPVRDLSNRYISKDQV